MFGNKFTRDQKALQPIVDQINALRPKMAELSNDELRKQIDDVRAEIAKSTEADYQAIAEIREKVEDLPIDERQPLWDYLDLHYKKILDILDDQLEKHLPVVFAAVRET
ncbi:MAG: hypothetical protein K2K84_08320, partial [Muribaculaceae bacterium]|nr:hypothetical protein [Muribaculaceae bacterium]